MMPKEISFPASYHAINEHCSALLLVLGCTVVRFLYTSCIASISSHHVPALSTVTIHPFTSCSRQRTHCIASRTCNHDRHKADLYMSNMLDHAWYIYSLTLSIKKYSRFQPLTSVPSTGLNQIWSFFRLL